jgi:hypothetical protein
MPKIFSVNVSFPKEVDFEVARTHNDFSYSISKTLTKLLSLPLRYCHSKDVRTVWIESRKTIKIIQLHQDQITY